MIHHYFQQLNGKEVLFVVGLFSYLFIFLSICDKVRANTCLSFDKRTCQHFLKFYKFTYHELSPENIKAKKKFTNFIVNIVFRDNVWQSYVTWQRRIISGNLIFSDAAKKTSFFFSLSRNRSGMELCSKNWHCQRSFPVNFEKCFEATILKNPSQWVLFQNGLTLGNSKKN